MKKKLLAMLFSGAIAFGVFAVPGNVVKAEEPCACHEIGPVTGEVRNQIVAELLSSDAFKTKKAELMASGSIWTGAVAIEVVVPKEGMIMVGVPFKSPTGSTVFHVFINGIYAGPVPM
ncbi:hypothetical protein [Bacillus sp. EB01]|uniref:hypothetical protein n=1 Tax=Bacillus sp. EB01 TaxID=1347086 RepID=UPI0005C5E242|nr:hypothetical protein [Bacillus sp. EB01]